MCSELSSSQKLLDDHVQSVSGFNTNGVPRLEWQNGSVRQWRFTFRVPMFFQYQSRGPPPRAPENLHPWVKAAHVKSRSYRANPNRPRVRAIEGREFRSIGDCRPNKLEYGDVVGLVFTVVYVETSSNWAPIYMLSDIIRVQRANREAYPLGESDEGMDPEAEDGNFIVTNLPRCELRFLAQ